MPKKATYASGLKSSIKQFQYNGTAKILHGELSH